MVLCSLGGNRDMLESEDFNDMIDP